MVLFGWMARWLIGEMRRRISSPHPYITATLFLKAFGPMRRKSQAPVFFVWKTILSACLTRQRFFTLQVPFSQEEICEAHREVIRANKLDAAYIRPLVFLGSEGMGLRAEGLKVHVGIAGWDWPSYMSPETLETGLKVRTSSYTRHHVNITMVKAKASGNYINSMLALREALDSGCDEAIMLDPEGYVAEGSAENFFMVRDGVIYTPDLTSCLDGITRDTVFKLAADHGIEVREKRITRDEVYICDEAFFTGTAAEIVPIREYDSRIIGDGKRGPIATVLQAAYFDLVRGKNDKYQDWLAPVAE